MREADPRGPEGRRVRPDPAAVAAVPGQGHFPGSELDADLVGAAGMQPDPDQGQDTFRGFRGLQDLPFTEGFLHALAGPVRHKGLVGPLVVIQQIGKSENYRVDANCNGIADRVAGDIMGADTSGSEFSYDTPSDADYYYGLVATRRGSTISLAFRASRRPQALLSQPVFYTEVHFQGKADQ